MQKIFTSLNKELPLITKILIVSGNFLREYFLLAIIFLLLGILGFRFTYVRSEKLRHFLEKKLLRIPFYKQLLITRFAATLGFQLTAGIPLTEAIVQGAKVVKNRLFHQYMETVAQKIKDGAPIDKSFRETGLFDTMFIASIATGQKTGRLPEFIQRMAIYYEKKLSLFLNRIVSLAEPVCILFLGLIVGFIVMSIIVPLFDINQLMK
jgi:type II secretory pathway component PulF